MRFQGPRGIRSTAMAEETEEGTCRCWWRRSLRCSHLLPAASRSTPLSAAVGTPSGSWKRQILMAKVFEKSSLPIVFCPSQRNAQWSVEMTDSASVRTAFQSTSQLDLSRTGGE